MSDSNVEGFSLSPIQRILLLHLNLYEICMKGESLGEGASLEEISEQILYYHRDRRIGITLAEDGEGNLALGMNSLLEEAVQFLGLCTAFYTLPSSLNTSKSYEKNTNGNQIDGSDTTKAIYFGNSTLVFIPLESSSNILAIAQISRLYHNGIKSDIGSGSPLAIQASIEQSHRLFCMLRGGGILYRLKSCTTQLPQIQGQGQQKNCPYNGMRELFSLLKDIRKLKASLVRKDPSDGDYELVEIQIKKLYEEVRLLRKSLPIQSIRCDLDAHYKDYLSDFSLIVSRNGGAGRCMVDRLPTPIPQDSGSHTYQVPPSFAKPRAIELLRRSLQQITNNFTRAHVGKIDLDLLGIASYHGGQLLHLLGSPGFDLSNEDSNLLMAYMASYRTKMNCIAQRRSSILEMTSTATSLDPPLGLKKLTLSFGSLADEPPSRAVQFDPDVETDRIQSPLHRRGKYLHPPPSSMLNASYQTYCVEGGDHKDGIWAPLVHLPARTTQVSNSLGSKCKDDNNYGIFVRAIHMVHFHFLDYSFLLFVSLPLIIKPSSKELFDARLFLMKLEEDLSEAVILSLNGENIDDSIENSLEPTSTMEWTNSPGQDIILLQRSKHKLILFQDPTYPISRRDKKRSTDTKGREPQRRFFGFGRKKKEKIPAQSTFSGPTRMEWSALGLDCRHLLASRLPLDVCLAFDDMISEVARRKESGEKSPVEKSTSASLELCTCMPYGWIYAFKKDEREIYAFFDNSIYVTVADVQSAASRIQEIFAAS